MASPVPRRVFISYSRQSPEHVDRVRRLYELLRANGVDARADFPAQERPQNWARWTGEQLRLADHILIAVSPEYRRQFDGEGTRESGHGVRWEAELILGLAYDDPDLGVQRVLIVLLPGARVEDVPAEFGQHNRSRYIVETLDAAGITPLLRVLTSQPEYVERPVAPVVTLPRTRPVGTAALRLVVERRDQPLGSTDARRLIEASCARAGVTALDLGLDGPGGRADIPLLPGRDLIGRWLRALHEQVDEDRRAVRVRVGIAVHPDDPEARELAADLAFGETARALHAVPDGELVIAVSEAFHALTVSGSVRFPHASAYREATVDRAGGRSCKVAVAGHAVCPEPPPPRSEGAAARTGRGDPLGGGDTYQVTVHQADRLHIGPVFGREERRR